MSQLTFIKNNKSLVVFAVIASIAVIAVIGAKIKKEAATLTQNGQNKAVSLISVKDYLKEKSITLDAGTVEALNQADLSSQISAPITEIEAAIGDKVYAGQVLVSLKNGDILAQLDQAKAGLDAANAGLAALKKGARSEDIRIAQTQEEQSKVSLVAAIEDSYAKSDDAVRNHINKFFTDPTSKFPRFSITINSGTNQAKFGATDTDAADRINLQKVVLEQRLNDWQESLAKLGAADDPTEYLSQAKDDLNFIIDFMNNLSALANSLTSDNSTYKQILDGYKAELSGARSAVSGSLMSLFGAETGWKLAQQTLQLKIAGATPEQLQQQEAAVAQATAAVSALQAQVDKTYIKSPIAGRVSFIDARLGELVVPGQLIVSIVNPDVLQVKTYASEKDVPNISVGDEVLVEGGVTGKIFRISPAIDPQTKKVEVIIAIDKKNALTSIVVGQTVSISIQSKILAKSSPVYLLPIQAVKSNSQSYVFTVDENGTIVQIPVKTGNLAGENIEVTADFNSDLKIFASVIGLVPGQKVTIR